MIKGEKKLKETRSSLGKTLVLNVSGREQPSGYWE